MRCLLAIFSILAVLFALMQPSEAVDCSYRKKGCMWTMQHDPVCGVNGCNYGNSGEAACGGTTVAHKGHC